MWFIFLVGVLFAADSTLNWSNLPRKETVVTGKSGKAVRFTTNDWPLYKGYFSAAATSSTGHLTRRLWFSASPLGEPLSQIYKKGRTKCDVSGVEIKLMWSQEDKPTNFLACKLERNKTYYLNHSQAAFGSGSGPSKTSALIRGSSVSGRE